MAITLTVDAQTLKNTASRFSTQKQTIQNLTNSMMQTVNSLTGCSWSGDAQTSFLNQFRKLTGDMDEIQRKLAEHIADLLAIAGNVETTEQQTQQAVKGLGTDFVQMF